MIPKFAPKPTPTNDTAALQSLFMNAHLSKNLVGPEIRKLRCQLGWTQAKLAKILAREGLDITRSSLAKVECQLVWVGDFELLYFVRALGVRLEHLFPPLKTGNAIPQRSVHFQQNLA